MKSELMSIGKMAEINHLSVATLRLYDKLGLIKPEYVDEETNYRFYDIRQNARLDMIAYMKDLGMSLAEIKDVLKKEDLNIIEDILIKKNEQIHKQIDELKRQHERVEQAIRNIERRRKSPTTGTLSLEYIDRRYIWGIDCDKNFYTDGIESYEASLCHLRRELLSSGFTHVQSYSVGTSIKLENFKSYILKPEKLFVFLDHRTSLLHPSSIILDSSMYACIYVDSFSDEAECAKKLLDYCNSNGYTISGDYICEVMSEANIFNTSEREMFLRLQVPVAFK